MGLGTITKVEGVQNKRREGEKMRDWLCFLLVKPSVLDCFELNNLTVIDLHVMRSAVHLINVVADFRKGTFHNFLPNDLW